MPSRRMSSQLPTMPMKDHTLIPRSSPPKAVPKSKPSAKGAGATVASLGNAPIPLRGGSRPVSIPVSTYPGMDILRPLQPRPSPQYARPSTRPRASSAAPAPASSFPANSNQTHQRFSSSHIPAPLRGSGGGGLGLRLSLPRPTSDKSSQPKATRHLSPGPRFHVPLVHSPAAKAQPAMDAGVRTTTVTNEDASAGKRISNTITAELLLPRSPPSVPTPEQPQQSAPTFPVKLPLARTPTMQSDASAESAYTTHSLGYDDSVSGGVVRECECEYGGTPVIRVGQDAEGDQNQGVAMAPQSPGFSMIEAMLEQENWRPSPPAGSDVDSTCRPHVSSRDDASRASTSTLMPTQRTSPPSTSPSLHSYASTLSARDNAMNTNAMANTCMGHAAPGIDAAAATSTHHRALADLKSLLGPVRVSQWIDEACVLQAHQACSGTYRELSCPIPFIVVAHVPPLSLPFLAVSSLLSLPIYTHAPTLQLLQAQVPQYSASPWHRQRTTRRAAPYLVPMRRCYLWSCLLVSRSCTGVVSFPLSFWPPLLSFSLSDFKHAAPFISLPFARSTINVCN